MTEEPLFSTEEIGEINQKLQSTLGQEDVRDFSRFNLCGRNLAEGEFGFTVDGSHLKLACQAARIVSGAASLIKLVVFKDRVKVAGFNQISFEEMFIPLATALDLQPGEEYGFVFDGAVMLKVAQYSEGVIEFTYVPDKKMLVVKSGESRLELPTQKTQDFTDYHGKMQDPKYLGKIKQALFKTGVKYIQKFVKKDSMQYNLSLAECRDGMLVGGTIFSVGIFQAPVFKDLSFRLKQEVLGELDKILPYFRDDTVSVFETDSYFIFRDSSLFFGVEKYSFTFPSIKPFLGVGSSEEALTFKRKPFVLALQRLSILSQDQETFVNLRIAGVGENASLSVVVKDTSGKILKDVVQVTRKVKGEDTGDWSDKEWRVNLHNLLRVVSGFDQELVRLFEIKGKALAIVDPTEEYTAISVVALNTEKGKTQKAVDDKKGSSQLSAFVNQHILKR